MKQKDKITRIDGSKVNPSSGDVPLLTIITVVKNGIKTLDRAINSVINQTYKNVEYIIIDGGSTDGTVKIIKRYEKYLAYWASRPDNGIYDAMNRGLKIASGEYVYFLGADDYLYDKDVLECVSSIVKETRADIFYGNIIFFNKYHNKPECIKPRFGLASLKFGFPLTHQAVFLKRKIDSPQYFFNDKYKISADFDLFCRIMKKRERKIIYVNKIISFYNQHGFSSQSKLLENEYSRIIRSHFGEGYRSLFLLRKKLINFLKIIARKTGLIEIYYLFLR